MLIDFIKRFFVDPLYAGGLLVFIGVFSLCFAFIAQYGFNLQPCILCIYQRWPYAAVILLGLVALYFRHSRPKVSALFIFFGALSFFTGMSIAGFHFGVEQKWWTGTESCGIPDMIANSSIEDLEAIINAAPAVRCDEVAWTLFGLSMTAYNLILSLGYGVYATLASIFITRKENGA